MGKARRHQMILELIQKREIETQEEIVSYFAEEGISVTQATISRDIRELKLKKRPGVNKTLVYTLGPSSEKIPETKYIHVLKNSLISIEISVNLLVIKTVPGMAMAAAAALDDCNFYEVLGCIAGDDTILCVARSIKDTIIIKKKIEKMME